MEDFNFTDEHLAIITTGIVASIRKRFSQIDGLLYVSLAVFIVSLVGCLLRYFGKGEVVLDFGQLALVLIKAIWVALMSLTGVNALTYLLDKNGSKNDESEVSGNR